MNSNEDYRLEGIRLSFHNTNSFSFQKNKSKIESVEILQKETIHKLYQSMWTWSSSAADAFMCEFVRPAGMSALFSLK